MNNLNAFNSVAEEYAHRIWDKKDLNAIRELLDPNIVVHSLLGDHVGSESMRKVIEAWLNAFPDLVVINKAVICQRDLVVIQWDAKGTHLGEFKDLKPTQKIVAYEGVSIYKICDNLISEYWAYLDMQYLLNQIR